MQKLFLVLTFILRPREFQMQLLDGAGVACDVSDIFEHQKRIGNILIRHSEVIFILYAEQNYCFIHFSLLIVQSSKEKFVTKKFQ
jgi:hypothetical protein